MSPPPNADVNLVIDWTIPDDPHCDAWPGATIWVTEKGGTTQFPSWPWGGGQFRLPILRTVPKGAPRKRYTFEVRRVKSAVTPDQPKDTSVSPDEQRQVSIDIEDPPKAVTRSGAELAGTRETRSVR